MGIEQMDRSGCLHKIRAGLRLGSSSQLCVHKGQLPKAASSVVKDLENALAVATSA